jgi:o-succinylbenzoate---CoA ligase
MNSDRIIINNQSLTVEELKQQFKYGSTPEWKSRIYNFIIDWFNNDDFILQKTSGSTGIPKEMPLKKSAMISSAKTTINYFNLQPGDTAWLCLPVEYIAGKMMIVRSIVGKLNLLITEPVGLPIIPAEKVNFASMVPMQVKRLIDENADFNKIDKLIIGGASIDYSLHNSLQTIPVEVYATYGMTETCSHIALQRINGNNPEEHFKVLEGITVGLNNSNCLMINAPSLSPNPIETTDLAEIISPTEFKWLGRADNVINSGGIKISPEELEAIITPLIGTECIISSKKDHLLGSRIVLVIEENPSDRNTESMLEEISSITGKHKAPKEVLFIDKFPLNESMKIDRKAIEQLISQTNQDNIL